jgi:hypothetical protein
MKYNSFMVDQDAGRVVTRRLFFNWTDSRRRIVRQEPGRDPDTLFMSRFSAVMSFRVLHCTGSVPVGHNVRERLVV